jgi:predicted Zn-dependent protease
MKFRRRSLSLLFFLGGALCFSEQSQSGEKLADQARQEYAGGKFTDAERHFRELLKRDPSNVEIQVYLGQALFRQEKYAESVVPYEKARELERNGGKLNSEQHRILVDQLVMAYGMSRNLGKARAVLDDAIRQDPEYPLNYYNLACTFAEEGNKSKVLSNLSLAFQRKQNVLKGEKMPDPRVDSSFEKFARDPDFIKLVQEFGYN